jgi:CubicO group peptidase (beta-lactamase class C family)
VNGPVDPIRLFLAARCADGRMPGAAWWVGTAEADRAPVSCGSVGHATLEPRAEPLEDETPFDLASLTKPLATATLAVLLEQDGRIDLDSPLRDHLPELANSPLGASSLLVLARHQSGLPAWSPLSVTARTKSEFISAIEACPLAVKPGVILYSDLGYILLGFALERAARSTLDRLFSDRVARPLDLLRTAFPAGEREFRKAAATERGNAFERAMAGERGTGHPWRERLLRGEVHDANAHALGGVAGHAGLFGPVGEVARLAGEILAPRRLPLGGVAQRRLLRPAGGGRTVGWVVAAGSSAARGILADDAPGHTGFTGTSVWLDLDRRGVLVLLTNRVHPSVPDSGFQTVRRGFHRLALRALG